MYNACIVSFFMNNVDQKTVGLQKSVVEKYNVSKYPHYIINTTGSPAQTMDHIWALNGIKTAGLKNVNIEKRFDHDIIFFLDIDAIPLTEKAIDLYVEKASEGKLIGNAQRSGHIENKQHVFAAPSCVALSVETYLTIGKPSAEVNSRSDVCEEYTWAAEKAGVKVDLFMPLRYDSPPIRMDWETNQEPFWRLADGMPNYGIGTTFGSDHHGDLFYHNFQIFHPGQQERFWAKCESVLLE